MPVNKMLTTACACSCGWTGILVFANGLLVLHDRRLPGQHGRASQLFGRQPLHGCNLDPHREHAWTLPGPSLGLAVPCCALPCLTGGLQLVLFCGLSVCPASIGKDPMIVARHRPSSALAQASISVVQGHQVSRIPTHHPLLTQPFQLVSIPKA
ncbi:hypothetical protein TgHK011_003989 [Trichoderma gracile]|nr:hypothetical protein TgHK011_003989 [Trichoderma gracile]